MRVLIAYSILFFLLSPVLTAQNLSVTELKAEIHEASADTQKVRLLTSLAEKLADIGEVPAAEERLTEAEKLTDSLGYNFGRQLVYLNRSYLFLLKMQPDSAQKTVEMALQRYPKSSLANKYYNYLGTAFRFQGKNEQALEYYNKAIAHSDTVDNVHTLAAIRQNMAEVYKNMDNKTETMRHYLNGLTYAESAQDTMFLATLLNNIGKAYADYVAYEKAEHYLQRSLNLSKAIGFKVGLLRASLNLANAKSSLRDFDTALNLYQQALDLSAQVRPGQPPVRINHNLGRLYYKMGNMQEAEKYLQQSLSQSVARNMVEGIYHNSKGLANVASGRDRIEEAIEWHEKALLAASELKYPTYQEETRKKLYELHKKQGSYQQALEHLEAFYVISDSLKQLENDQALAEYETKLNLRRQEQINQLLQDKQREQEARLDTQQWLVGTSLLAMVLILIIMTIIVKANRDKKRANQKLEARKQELEQLNEVKNKLFAIVSHDLRNILAGLKGMLYLIRENDLSAKELQTLSVHLKVSIQQNSNIMENILVWARQQMEGITTDIKPLRVKPLVDKLLDSYLFPARQKGVTLANKVFPDIEVLADDDMLELVLRNLLSNSLKFSGETDCITVSAISKEDHVLFSVEDTGIGIPEAQKKTIFQSSTQTQRGTNNERGSGLGLNLCKEFIEKQQGSIHFESEEGKGTTFYFTLPKANQQSKPDRHMEYINIKSDE